MVREFARTRGRPGAGAHFDLSWNTANNKEPPLHDVSRAVSDGARIHVSLEQQALIPPSDKVRRSSRSITWDTDTAQGQLRIDLVYPDSRSLVAARVGKKSVVEAERDSRPGMDQLTLRRAVRTDVVVTPALAKAINGWNPLRRHKLTTGHTYVDEEMESGVRFTLVKMQARKSTQSHADLSQPRPPRKIERMARYTITVNGGLTYEIPRSTYLRLGGK
jgi:hypothetical protein